MERGPLNLQTWRTSLARTSVPRTATGKPLQPSPDYLPQDWPVPSVEHGGQVSTAPPPPGPGSPTGTCASSASTRPWTGSPRIAVIRWPRTRETTQVALRSTGPLLHVHPEALADFSFYTGGRRLHHCQGGTGGRSTGAPAASSSTTTTGAPAWAPTGWCHQTTTPQRPL